MWRSRMRVFSRRRSLLPQSPRDRGGVFRSFASGVGPGLLAVAAVSYYRIVNREYHTGGFLKIT